MNKEFFSLKMLLFLNDKQKTNKISNILSELKREIRFLMLDLTLNRAGNQQNKL